MNPTIEELIEKWEYLVPITLQKIYGNPHKYATSLHLGYDDLYQFGMIGLWNGVKSWQENPIGKERSFMIRHIRWECGKRTDREKSKHQFYKNTSKKYADRNFVVPITSMSKAFDEENQTDFYDVISCDNITSFKEDNLIETKIFTDAEYDGMLSILNDTEKEMVLLRMKNDLGYKELGEIFGMTKQGIGMRFKKIQNKISQYRMATV
jgi:RNA polymerase sigma factor (sigma-70 family)